MAVGPKTKAARSRAAAKPASTPAPTEGLHVKVVLEVNSEIDPIYANYADVSQSQYEVEINFARAPARLSPDQLSAIRAGEPLVIYPNVKVILPKDLLPGLVTALTGHLPKPEESKN